jgi:hypothetical protein
MASPHDFLHLTLAEWLDELAQSRSAPGGGSALAFALATAAAVLAMAARISESGGLVAQAEALRARTAPLAQVDADWYEAALAAGVARGAVELVAVNLTAVDGDPRVAEARRYADEAAKSAARAGC